MTTPTAGASEELVTWEASERIATLTFNRPERNNAFTTDMEHQYFDLLERAANDPDVRVIIVTGAGRSFCPGLDMEALRAGVAEGAAVRVGPAVALPLGRGSAKMAGSEPVE